MREIKFRIWDNVDKTMLYSKLLLSKFFKRIENRNHLQNYIMQYTGLKDKNGKEIYEGDIVKSSRYKNSVSEIVWSIYNWAFRTNTRKGIRDYDFCVGSFGQDEYEKPYSLDNFEVIGNIYENPELLGKEWDMMDNIIEFLSSEKLTTILITLNIIGLTILFCFRSLK